MIYFANRVIDGKETEILDASEPNHSELEEIRNNYACFPAVLIDLGSMENLALFEQIQTLILTGGIPTRKGLSALYAQQKITTLILDYEETDSDENGINLTRFPLLKRVLTRSNLNICCSDTSAFPGICITVLNHYHAGKPVRSANSSACAFFEPERFLFFSTESESPAASLLMDILRQVEDEFLREYSETVFSEQLDSIAVIPVCVSQAMIERGFGKERRYVSLKRRFADVRLRISYSEFIQADRKGRISLCRECVHQAAQYIESKDKTFHYVAFLTAIDRVFTMLD